MWEKEIDRFGKGGAYIYSDGSLLEGGNVGGGAFVVSNDGAEEETEYGIGDISIIEIKIKIPWRGFRP